MTYYVKFTDKNKTPIEIDEQDLDNSKDITLFGRRRLEYGEDMNANLLHILENFACVEDSSNVGNPDVSKTSTLSETAKKILATPIEGQLWFNKTQKRMFIWEGAEWIAIAIDGDIAVNWGEICDGEQIPAPHDDDGYIYDYSECVWIVSPRYRSGAFDSLLCYADSNAYVTMKYITGGSEVSGITTYMIVGIRGNTNLGSSIAVTVPVPTQTPTPTVSVTPSIGPSSTPVPTPTRTPTRTRTPTPSPSSGGTPTPTPTVSPDVTPSATVSITPSETPAPGVSPTATPTPTPAVSFSPTTTPTPTPPVTPTVTPSPSYVTNIYVEGLPDELRSWRALTAAWVELNILADGTWNSYEHIGNNNSGTWLVGSNGSDYEFFYTYSDSSIPGPVGDPGPGANTWHDFPVSFYGSDANTATETFIYINYTIRRKANHADQQVGSILFDVDGECFAVGTQLLTNNGYKNVEELAVGDVVLSFDLDGMVDESVENWKDWSTTSLKSMTIKESTVRASRRFKSTTSVTINGLTTTETHVYFVYSDNKYCWKYANEVVATDKLVTKTKRKVDITNISVNNTDEIEFVALNVETLDTLIVNDGGTDILAHNASA